MRARSVCLTPWDVLGLDELEQSVGGGSRRSRGRAGEEGGYRCDKHEIDYMTGGKKRFQRCVWEFDPRGAGRYTQSCPEEFSG